MFKQGQVAIQLVKFAFHTGYDVDTGTAMWIEMLFKAVAFSTDDKKEGTLVFFSKEKQILLLDKG